MPNMCAVYVIHRANMIQVLGTVTSAVSGSLARSSCNSRSSPPNLLPRGMLWIQAKKEKRKSDQKKKTFRSITQPTLCIAVRHVGKYETDPSLKPVLSRQDLPT